jgi:preprotein translocase subunit YajC
VESVILQAIGLLGQAAGGGGNAPAATNNTSPLVSFLPMMVMIGLLFYMLVMRPQKKEQSKRASMIDALKKNDRVVTIGGIYGVVANVHREADEVTIKVDEATNTKIRVTLGAISRVVGEEEPSAAAPSLK